MARGYFTKTVITDYGPYVTKIMIPVPGTVAAEDVCADQFSVYVERVDDTGEIIALPKSWMAVDDTEPSKGYIPVTDAYPSDKAGEPAEEGSFITLAMAYGPAYPLSATMSAPKDMNVQIHNCYTITQVKELKTADGSVNGMVFDRCLGNDMPQTEFFRNTISGGEEPLRYGYFIPQGKAEKKPLIIWLHGAGEGGTDPMMPYIANEVVHLASEEIQSYYEGGAYLFVPQTPTFWMNDGSGTYGRTGKSMYVKALKYAIDEFVDNNPGIDRDRIYVGGDSNGGFMTMRMIIDYPDFFAAAFPVCEALMDKAISDEDIKSICDMPIWFTHAKNDPVVLPNETVVPTYKRLIAAGGKNIHFTFWDKIVDLHEGFVDKDGKPFEYIGHFAWVHVLNDDCRLDYDEKPVVVDGEEVTLLQWLAKQKR